MRPRLLRLAVDVTILVLGTAASPTGASGLMDVPDSGQAVALVGQDLQLNIIINGHPANLIGSFKQSPDGSLLATTEEIRAIGLVPPSSGNSDRLVPLTELPGVAYRLDQQTQSLFITAPDRALVPHTVNLRPGADDALPQPQRSYGGILNYTLFGSSDGSFWRDLKTFQGMSGAFDARAFGPYGTFSQSLIASTAAPSQENFVRLDSTWTYSDMDELITYRAGDLISGGLSWTRPYRLGGLQMQRSFSLRPDLVTMPIPSLSGSAAVPSTLDVYSQNAKVFSGAIPPGPFQLTNFPVVTGAGTASVVVSDALGRQTITTLPFYASNQLLREGLYDFSGELGFARRFYGIESDNYDARPMASMSGRYGLTDWLTLEGHAEGGDGLINGGAGATFGLGPIGVASFAMAASQSAGGLGGLMNASLEMNYRGISFYARSQRTVGQYEDIASITTPLLDSKFKEFSFLSARVPKKLDQVSLGLPLSFDRSSLNLSYTQLESAIGDRNRIVGLSYSRNIFNNSTIFASAFKDLDHGDSFGVFVGISIPLGNDVTVTAGGQHTPTGSSSVVDAVKSERLQEGSYGWRIRDVEGQSTERSASASYRSSFGRAEATVQQYGGSTRATAQFDGSIAFAGGGVFFGNRIDDAFAVVNAGAPNVAVQYENRPIGVTDGRGLLLVPYLNSFQKNKISIDAKNLPVDADVPKTKDVIVPADRGGVVVNFGISEAPQSALVTFIDQSRKPVQVGAEGHLQGNDQSFVIGYDGQAYVRGLAAQNLATLALPDGSSCRAEFGYKPETGKQVSIENVVCH